MKANVTFFKQKGMQNHANLHGLGLPQLFPKNVQQKKIPLEIIRLRGVLVPRTGLEPAQPYGH